MPWAMRLSKIQRLGDGANASTSVGVKIDTWCSTTCSSRKVLRHHVVNVRSLMKWNSIVLRIFPRCFRHVGMWILNVVLVADEMIKQSQRD